MERRLGALRELNDSVVILDRAAEASDPPLSVEAMRGQVGGLRREAVAVLTALAEERAGAGARVEAMEDTLTQMREGIQAEDPHEPEHELHAAVAFGLREVRRTLDALVTAVERG
jgi:hypothetical protein